MINTTDKGDGGYRNPFSYIPMDPKYFYTATYGNRNRYQAPTPYDAQNHPSPNATIEDLLIKKNEIMDSKIGMLLTEIYDRHRIKHLG